MLSGGQSHVPGTGHNGAFVDDRRAGENGIAPVGHGDASLIDHRRQFLTGLTEETVVAGQKVFVGQVHGRGYQTTHIDLGVRSKQNSVGIDEKDVAVGTERPQNGGRVRPRDSIQNHRELAGLQEHHRFRGAYGEAIPIHDGAVRKLLNLGLGAGNDVDLSVPHLGPGGVGESGQASG